MNIQPTPPRAIGDLGYLIDWDVACRARANVLIIGPHDRTAARLHASRLDLLEPVIDALGHEGLRLPPVNLVGTLLLQDVGRLSPVDQESLEIWLRGPHLQVISTSPVSLLPRVRAGMFVETLYYRLNMVCLDVNDLPVHCHLRGSGFFEPAGM